MTSDVVLDGDGDLAEVCFGHVPVAIAVNVETPTATKNVYVYAEK